MSKYPVIIFEGIETSGKTTNIKIISNYLKKINRKFIKIREPGGCKNSELIRSLILNKKSNFNLISDFLLMMASRSENIDKIIKKNNKKKIILIDRFSDSTFAYQHYGMGINLDLIKKINNLIIGKFKPNITFLSIVNSKNMRDRLRNRKNKNKYDNFNYSFYNKVQKGYIKLSQNNKKYVIIDSNKNTIKQNSSIIINTIKKIIK
tara:strand:+ start:266 stop:883 length:618 start_codon:yes stop_codon:yes gene_type:complete